MSSSKRGSKAGEREQNIAKEKNTNGRMDLDNAEERADSRSEEMDHNSNTISSDSSSDSGSDSSTGSSSGSSSDSGSSGESDGSSSDDDGSEDGEDDEDEEFGPEATRHTSFRKLKSKLKFRNYKPHSEQMQDMILPPPPILEDMEWIDNEIRIIVERAQQGDDSQLSLEPKKASWDLERDLTPKLEILNARTQRALVDMIRSKIQKQESSKS